MNQCSYAFIQEKHISKKVRMMKDIFGKVYHSSITSHHLLKWQILPLLEEKVAIFLKNFFYLA